MHTNGGDTASDQGHVGEKESTKMKKNVGMAVIAYLIFFIPLLTEAKHDSFVSFHVRQGMVLFLYWVAMAVLSMVPLLGVVVLIGYPVGLVLLIIGCINAARGKEKELPLIGSFASYMKF